MGKKYSKLSQKIRAISINSKFFPHNTHNNWGISDEASSSFSRSDALGLKNLKKDKLF